MSANIINFHISQCDSMKKYPKEIFYIGDTNLLNQPKVAIIGSRSPNQYCCKFTHELATKLSKAGICIVSGGAMGVDTIAHKAANSQNTIMVAGTGLDKRYPAINRNLIEDIEQNGLVLSQFKVGIPSNRYNFPIRNELIVALGDVLIVTYADLNSGSMRSIEYALKMGKKIYVLPHRIGESQGTNDLLLKGKAEAIYNIDLFIENFGLKVEEIIDDFLIYCATSPTYDEAIKIYGAKVFEYELMGKIDIQNGILILK